MKSPWNFSKFELLMNFQLYKAEIFYKIPHEIWLTLSRFTGRQEKKDALAGPTILGVVTIPSLMQKHGDYP